MRFLVSACLLGCPCKYSGGDNSNPEVKKFLVGKQYRTICPEVAGGLSVPRDAAEIVGGDGAAVLAGHGSVITKRGKDVSANYRAGAEAALALARNYGARAAILKTRSPSCGHGAIYDGGFSGGLTPGDGVTGAALAAAGLLIFSEEALPKEGLAVDYQGVAEKISAWLKEKVTGAGAQGCVLGLSGGIDSAVVAALAQQAFPGDVLAAILPVGSESADVEDAWLVARHLGLETVEINLDEAYAGFLKAVESGVSEGGDRLPAESMVLARSNIKPRLRMAALYYLAACRRYLVVGTGNKSEIVTGFFTKHGDAAVDLEPIGALVKTQVWELARHLQLPARIIEKKPSAGLWPGQEDESELGFSYRQLDQYILSGATDADVLARIERAIRLSRHKQEMPPVCPL